MKVIFTGSVTKCIKDVQQWLHLMNALPYDPKNYPPPLPTLPQDIWETPSEDDPSQAPPDRGASKGWPVVKKPITPPNTPTPPNTEILDAATAAPPDPDRLDAGTSWSAEIQAANPHVTLAANPPEAQPIPVLRPMLATKPPPADLSAAPDPNAPRKLGRRGRPKGSKIVNGKMVVPLDVQPNPPVPLPTAAEAKVLAEKVAESIKSTPITPPPPKATAASMFDPPAPSTDPSSADLFQRPSRDQLAQPSMSRIETPIEALTLVTMRINLDAGRNLMSQLGYQRVSEVVGEEKCKAFIEACKNLVLKHTGGVNTHPNALNLRGTALEKKLGAEAKAAAAAQN